MNLQQDNQSHSNIYDIQEVAEEGIPDEDNEKHRLPNIVPHNNTAIGVKKMAYNPRLFGNVDSKKATKY